jgi:hypothetical protein
VPGALRHKLEPVSEKGWFIGYEADAKAYGILQERNNRVIVSRDVIVDERAKGNEPRSELEVSPVEALGEKPGLNGEPARATQNPRKESPNGKKDEKKDGEVEEDTGETEEIGGTGESGDGVEKRYPTRERRAPGEWYQANMAADGKETEPQTYEEALAGPDAELWRRAMDEEFASLLENGTWELEKLPDGFKALPMKWVYKIKRDANGNIEPYKARLVAKWYLQKQGVDFEEVYAPVSKHTTLRALLAVVAARDMELHQLDVKTAFLNGELEEEIYMQQAQGYCWIVRATRTPETFQRSIIRGAKL